MRVRRIHSLLAFAGLGLAAAPLAAQEGAPDAVPKVLEVGEMAPDFELDGATRFGTLAAPVRLSDYRGKTVVLAFFYRVRTPG